jgi:hypothetical protein
LRKSAIPKNVQVIKYYLHLILLDICLSNYNSIIHK